MEDIYKLKPEQFPKGLLEIPQPPKTLYIRGKLPSEDMIYLAVVGSRKYTSYGKDICEKLIRGLKILKMVWESRRCRKMLNILLRQGML